MHLSTIVTTCAAVPTVLAYTFGGRANGPTLALLAYISAVGYIVALSSTDLAAAKTTKLLGKVGLFVWVESGSAPSPGFGISMGNGSATCIAWAVSL